VVPGVKARSLPEGWLGSAAIGYDGSHGLMENS